MLYEYEGFILERAIEKYPFGHWASHVVSFWGRFSEEPIYHASEDEFPRLRSAVAAGVSSAGYDDFAREIEATHDEQKLNGTIARQYTEETNFYRDVNYLLRSAHSGNEIGEHAFAPWILQFNCALRLMTAYRGPAYRGTTLTEEQISLYHEQDFFVWAPFVSASKSLDACLGGNVLFELRPWGAIDEYEKRDGRDISIFSAFPSEEEVIFPMCCAYRPVDIIHKTSRVEIVLEVVDMQ